MFKCIVSFSLLLNCLCLSAEDQWNLNDVSYLFKIPTAKIDNTDTMLGPMNSGNKGELLPLAWYERTPVLYNSENGRGSLYQKELKAVSVRIDPCPNTYDPKACSPEIRIVWQPVIYDQFVNTWAAQDAALHSFYRLTKSEFDLLKKDLWDLKLENKKSSIDTGKLPLGIHPALLNPNTTAKFNSKLQTIFLKNCGEKNLFKVTFMSLLTPNIWWRFGGVEKRNADNIGRIEIPRLGFGSQDIFNSAIEEDEPVYNPGTEMDAMMTLPNDYPELDDLLPMLNHGMRHNDKKDHDVFVQKLQTVERFRNPHKTNPTNLDCASCHFADDAAFYAGQRFADLKKFESPESYKNPNPALFDLSNTSIGLKGTRLTRAFGYFESKPSISQRAIHDSAETAQWMNTH